METTNKPEMEYDEEFERKSEALLNKLKSKNPNFELEVEYGRLLMKHINSFTPNERKRYDELTELLCKPKP